MSIKSITLVLLNPVSISSHCISSAYAALIIDPALDPEKTVGFNPSSCKNLTIPIDPAPLAKPPLKQTANFFICKNTLNY